MMNVLFYGSTCIPTMTMDELEEFYNSRMKQSREGTPNEPIVVQMNYHSKLAKYMIVQHWSKITFNIHIPFGIYVNVEQYDIIIVPTSRKCYKLNRMVKDFMSIEHYRGTIYARVAN